jgi:alpha-tubulin N-acetyltransferase 1
VGPLKYGYKDLFFYKKNGQVIQKRALCLLDFYVDSTEQRKGLGLLLFNKFLTAAPDLLPSQIAYDRPSPKLLAFMAKHFCLTIPDQQPNRFTLFEGFEL